MLSPRLACRVRTPVEIGHLVVADGPRPPGSLEGGCGRHGEAESAREPEKPEK